MLSLPQALPGANRTGGEGPMDGAPPAENQSVFLAAVEEQIVRF